MNEQPSSKQQIEHPVFTLALNCATREQLIETIRQLHDKLEQAQVRAAEPPTAPVTDADELSAFWRWYEQQRRESFVFAYGSDEPIERHPTWDHGYLAAKKAGWMARAALTKKEPTVEGALGEMRQRLGLPVETGGSRDG